MYDPAKPYKKQILDLIQSTWQTPYVKITSDIYPIIEKKFSYPEVQHTDGIGTKGIYHWQKRTFKNAVRDGLAMNLNDLLLVRATPYAIQNHIVLPEDDHEAVLEIVRALSEECRKRNIAITGGETSIHNNAQGLDISITVSGFIKRPKPNKFEIGDVLIGIASNGLHANGFTKVREVFGNEFREEFVSPTLMYWDALFPLLEKYEVHGMMHITGGAFTKLKALLRGADIKITRTHSLKPQLIFQELHRRGVTDEEMYKTFNCGIGLLLSSSVSVAALVVGALRKAGMAADIIGEVISGDDKVSIASGLSSVMIEY